MHAHSDYTIKLVGTEEEIENATAVVAAAFHDESLRGKDCIEIEETYQFVWVWDVVKLAESMVKNSPNLSLLTISGTVDTSESCGEYMNFLIKYENSTLTVQSSCWYLSLYADDFDDYEEFSEAFDYSEEEYEEFRQCPHYILDSGNGDIVTKVPLDDPEVIDLDVTDVYIKPEAAELSPVPVCRCECGTEVTLVHEPYYIAALYNDDSVPTSCEKCGKKYKVFMDCSSLR